MTVLLNVIDQLDIFHTPSTPSTAISLFRDVCDEKEQFCHSFKIERLFCHIFKVEELKCKLDDCLLQKMKVE